MESTDQDLVSMQELAEESEKQLVVTTERSRIRNNKRGTANAYTEGALWSRQQLAQKADQILWIVLGTICTYGSD